MRNIVYDGYKGPRLEREVQLRRLKNVIAEELTPRQRQMVMGVYYEKKTVTALAEELGVNKSTVSRTLQRAKRRLQNSLRYTF